MSSDENGPTASVFVLQAGVVRVVSSVCIAAAAGERADRLMHVAGSLFSNNSFAEKYAEENDVSSQKFAQRMGCVLRHALRGYLRASGCPESALEANLKFIAGEITESYPTYGDK